MNRLPLRRLLRPLVIFSFALWLSACAGPGPGAGNRGLTACFYDFTEVYQDRIYRVLKAAPGVDAVQRIGPGKCGTSGKCLCYRLEYSGVTESLTAWLRQRLPVNKAVPFRCLYRDRNHLDVIFDAGFK